MARPVEPEHAVLRPGDRLRAVPPQHVGRGLVRAELEERVALREARVPVADELDGDDALGLVERRDVGLVGEGREVALPEGAGARGGCGRGELELLGRVHGVLVEGRHFWLLVVVSEEEVEKKEKTKQKKLKKPKK